MAADRHAGSVIVHFGMPKTGTSSIQESLFRRLSDPRFHYVNFGRANASYDIATGFKADPARFHVHVKQATSADALRDIRTSAIERLNLELRSAAGKTAILSAEAIFNFRDPEIKQLCNALAGQGALVRAAGYFRRPKEYMESAFQQRVKAGSRLFGVTKLLPRYRTIVKLFDAALGRENTHIWLFDPASFSDHCVVQDFCSRLDIAFRPERVIRINEALSAPALSLLFAYRKFGPGYGTGPNVMTENRRLIDRLRELSGPKLRFHSSVVAPVIEQHREDIDWIEARMGQSLAEDLAADDERAVCAEGDLLKFTPDALRWLAQQLGPDFVKRWNPDMGPEQVAEWVHLLRLNLADTDERFHKTRRRRTGASGVPAGQSSGGDEPVTLYELVRRSKQSDPGLKELQDEDGRKLLREAFQLLRREIRLTRAGKVELEDLGSFHVTTENRNKDGQQAVVKRIAFRPAMRKAAAG